MLLVRIVLFVIVFFISYTLIGALLRLLGSSSRPQSRPGAEADRMVQCCQCGTYVPESDVIRRRIGGETRIFCSRSCLQEFKKSH